MPRAPRPTRPTRAARPRKPARTRDAERTRGEILDAATTEFAAHGLGGTRVDEIAARAGVNKALLYHYYGNKEGLFVAVLERAYAGIREAESELELEHLDPPEAMEKLVAFTWDYFLAHPEFITLLNSENLHEARHLKASSQVRALHHPLVTRIREVLARGAERGEFRGDVDPVQLYVTIAGLGYFYLSNAHTLGTAFGRDLLTTRAKNARHRHVQDVVRGYLRPEAA